MQGKVFALLGVNGDVNQEIGEQSHLEQEDPHRPAGLMVE